MAGFLRSADRGLHRRRLLWLWWTPASRLLPSGSTTLTTTGSNRGPAADDRSSNLRMTGLDQRLRMENWQAVKVRRAFHPPAVHYHTSDGPHLCHSHGAWRCRMARNIQAANPPLGSTSSWLPVEPIARDASHFASSAPRLCRYLAPLPFQRRLRRRRARESSRS